MPRRPWRVLPALRCDARGVAAVEFAMLAPALLVFLLGIVELSVIIQVGGTLDAAVLQASRFGVTGRGAGAVSRTDRIRQIIAERTFGLVDVDSATIETLVYPTFDSIGQPEPFTDANRNGQRDPGEAFSDVNGNGTWDADMGRAGLGGPGDIVVYEVTYETTGITSFMQPILGTVTHTASVAVRNEPF